MIWGHKVSPSEGEPRPELCLVPGSVMLHELELPTNSILSVVTYRREKKYVYFRCGRVIHAWSMCCLIARPFNELRATCLIPPMTFTEVVTILSTLISGRFRKHLSVDWLYVAAVFYSTHT